MRRVFVLLPVFSALWLASAVLIAGAFRPGYNHATQFISELAAAGTSGAAAMNFAGFLPAEFLMILFAGLGFVRFRESVFARVGFVLIALYAGLLSLAAFFPCDVGCRPADPSTDHLIHILAGLLAWVLSKSMIGDTGSPPPPLHTLQTAAPSPDHTGQTGVNGLTEEDLALLVERLRPSSLEASLLLWAAL